MAQSQLRTEQVTPSQYPHYIVEPDNSGLTFDSYTSCLLQFENGITDASGKIWTNNVGYSGSYATINNSSYKWGTGSLQFHWGGDYGNPGNEAAGHYLTTPYSSDFDLAGTDFTIEMWLNTMRTNGSTVLLTTKSSTPTDPAVTTGWTLGWPNLWEYGTQNLFFLSNGVLVQESGSDIRSIGGKLQDGDWHHVAVVKYGTEYNIYCDGVSIGHSSAPTGTVVDASNTMYLGRPFSSSVFHGTESFSAYIDQVRISKTARWTGTFSDEFLTGGGLDEAYGDYVQPYVGVTTTTTNPTGNVPQWTVTGTQLNAGLGVVTSIGTTGSNSNIPTEKAVADLYTGISTGSYLTALTGITSINKNGSSTLHGAVTLSPGANITLTQSGQDISIAALSSSVSSGALAVSPYEVTIADNGYSGTYVNSLQYIIDQLVSTSHLGTEYQAIAYWDVDGHLVIGTRAIPGAWTLHTYTSITIASADAHRSATIGFDKNGYLHVAYGHGSSGDALKYRMSDTAIDTWTGTLTNTLSMLGTNETSVIYPLFFVDPSKELYFIHNNSTSTYFYKYNASSPGWAAATGTGTGGLLTTGESGGWAYHFQPWFDDNFGSGGYLHLFVLWTGVAEDTRYDPSYFRWNGTAFTKADGTSQTIAVTPSNAGKVETLGPGGIAQMTGAMSDANGRPHVVYSYSDGSYRYIRHAWHNGTSWVVLEFTSRKTSTAGYSGTVGVYPRLLIDNDNVVYILWVNNDHPEYGILILKSAPNDFTTWTDQTLINENVGVYMPKFDSYQWRIHRVIYMPLIPYPTTGSDYPIKIIEYIPRGWAVWDAATHPDLHANDTDSGTSAIHHTLGTGSKQAAAGNHVHSAPALALNDLTDVDTAGESTGDVIYYNGSSWVVYHLGVASGLRYESGKITIGNYTGGNYLSVDAATGNLRLVGNATTFDDIVTPLTGAKITSPSSHIVQNDAEASVTFKTTCTTSDYVYTNAQMSHSWKTGSDISPHIHWWQDSATIPNWMIQYRWQINGGAKTTSWSSAKFSSHKYTYSSGTIIQITEFPDITPPVGAGLSDICQFRLLRDVANTSTLFSGTDGLAEDVDVIAFDVHYERDSLGSDQEFIKDVSAALLMETGDYLLLEDGSKILTE